MIQNNDINKRDIQNSENDFSKSEENLKMNVRKKPFNDIPIKNISQKSKTMNQPTQDDNKKTDNLKSKKGTHHDLETKVNKLNRSNSRKGLDNKVVNNKIGSQVTKAMNITNGNKKNTSKRSRSNVNVNSITRGRAKSQGDLSKNDIFSSDSSSQLGGRNSLRDSIKLDQNSLMTNGNSSRNSLSTKSMTSKNTSPVDVVYENNHPSTLDSDEEYIEHFSLPILENETKSRSRFGFVYCSGLANVSVSDRKPILRSKSLKSIASSKSSNDTMAEADIGADIVNNKSEELDHRYVQETPHYQENDENQISYPTSMNSSNQTGTSNNDLSRGTEKEHISIFTYIGMIQVKKVIRLIIGTVKSVFLLLNHKNRDMILHSKIFWHFCCTVAVHSLLLVTSLVMVNPFSKDNWDTKSTLQKISSWILTIPVPMLIFLQLVSKTVETYRFCKICYEFEDEANKAVADPMGIKFTSSSPLASEWDFVHPSLLKRPLAIISRTFGFIKRLIFSLMQRREGRISPSNKKAKDIVKNDMKLDTTNDAAPEKVISQLQEDQKPSMEMKRTKASSKNRRNYKGTSSVQRRREDLLEEQIQEQAKNIENLESELEYKGKQLTELTQKLKGNEVELQELRRRIASNEINLEIMTQKYENQKAKSLKLDSFNTFLKEELEKSRLKIKHLELKHSEEIHIVQERYESHFSNLVDEQRKDDFEWLEKEFKKMYEGEISHLRNTIFELEAVHRKNQVQQSGSTVPISQLHTTHPSRMNDDDDYGKVLFRESDSLLIDDTTLESHDPSLHN